jgi:cephalosporin-C deacetylase
LRSSHYPLEELNDHLRAGASAEAVEHTLSYFDPIRHAGSVAARTLIGVEDVHWYAPLVDALPFGEPYEVTHLDGTDADFYDAWLAGQFGVPAMSKFVR